MVRGSSDHLNRQQVRGTRERKTRFQPGEQRHRALDLAEPGRVGIERTMGQHCARRFRDGLLWLPGIDSCAARRNDACLFVDLCGRALRPRPVARRSPVDSGASTAKRRAAALCVLHDIRPQDGAGQRGRPLVVRRHRGNRLVCPAICAVRARRAVASAVLLRTPGATHRCAGARHPLSVDYCRYQTLKQGAFSCESRYF